MPNSRSYDEVMLSFFELIKSQNVVYFKKMAIEDFMLHVGTPLKEYFNETEYAINDTQHFVADPSIFASKIYPAMKTWTCPYFKKQLSQETVATVAKELLGDGVSLTGIKVIELLMTYLCVCRVNSDIPADAFVETSNYFVKLDQEGNLFEGPFEQVPSSFFGGEVLPLMKIDFPEDKDLLFVYSKEGVLNAVLKYGRGSFNSRLPE